MTNRLWCKRRWQLISGCVVARRVPDSVSVCDARQRDTIVIIFMYRRKSNCYNQATTTIMKKKSIQRLVLSWPRLVIRMHNSTLLFLARTNTYTNVQIHEQVTSIRRTPARNSANKVFQFSIFDFVFVFYLSFDWCFGPLLLLCIVKKLEIEKWQLQQSLGAEVIKS